MRTPSNRAPHSRLRRTVAASAVLAGLLLAGNFRGASAGDKKEDGDKKAAGGGVKIIAEFNPAMGFGLQLVDDMGDRQKITFDTQGRSNVTLIQIDDKKYVYGAKEDEKLPPGLEGGKWDPMKAALGKGRKGFKSVWVADGKIRITQEVEIVKSATGAEDTCLVTYTVENKDDKAHKVAVRVLVDTFIVDNDGHPFAVPGKKKLITTSADFRGAKDVPAVIQALQKANLKNPGLVASFTFRPGSKIEGPDRVSLTHLPMRSEDVIGWDIPVRNIKIDEDDPGDACVVMYWGAQELRRGGRRVVGYAYGGGPLAGAGKGKKVEEKEAP